MLGDPSPNGAGHSYKAQERSMYDAWVEPNRLETKATASKSTTDEYNLQEQLREVSPMLARFPFYLSQRCESGQTVHTKSS